MKKNGFSDKHFTAYAGTYSAIYCDHMDHLLTNKYLLVRSIEFGHDPETQTTY